MVDETALVPVRKQKEDGCLMTELTDRGNEDFSGKRKRIGKVCFLQMNLKSLRKIETPDASASRVTVRPNTNRDSKSRREALRVFEPLRKPTAGHFPLPRERFTVCRT